MLVPRWAKAWKSVPQGLKPSMNAASCGTAEAVPFVEKISFQDNPGVLFVCKHERNAITMKANSRG